MKGKQGVHQRLLSGVVFALVGILTLAGCGGTKGTGAKANDPVKLGFDGALSKTGGVDFGQAAIQALKLALKEYNAKGGYKGTPVESVIYDDQANPQLAIQNFTRLVKEDKVVSILGLVNTGNAQAAGPVAQENKIPTVITVATGVNIVERFVNEPKNYIFRVSMPDAQQVPVILDFMASKGFKKIGIAHDTAGYGQSGATEVQRVMKERGLTPVGVESFSTGDADMTAQLGRLRSAGAEAVIWYASSPEAAALFKSADKIGWRPPFVGPWAIAGSVFPSLVGKSGVGVHLVQSFTPDQSPSATAFDEKMKKEYGKDYVIPVVAAQTYDATNMVLKALDAVGPNPEAIRDYLESMKDFKGVTNVPAQPFSKAKHDAFDSSTMFVAMYDGEMRIVKAK